MIYQIKPRQGTYLLQILHGQFIGFHCLIFFLNIDKLDSFIISSGIIYHILGPKKARFPSPHDTVFILKETKGFSFGYLTVSLSGKTCFIISGDIRLTTLKSSIARLCIFPSGHQASRRRLPGACQTQIIGRKKLPLAGA